MVFVGLVMIVVAVAVLLYARRPHHTVVEPALDRTNRSNDEEELVEIQVPTAPPSLRPWIMRGISREEAKEWIDRGFDADHAYLLRSMEVDPRTAERLRQAGLEDSALIALVEESAFRYRSRLDDLVALAESSPDHAPMAVSWVAAGVRTEQALAFVDQGFTTAVAEPWLSAGWSADDAFPWFVARFDPLGAAPWHSAGFTATQARAWKNEHFGVRQAEEWKRLGDTPGEARLVERQFADARVTVTDGLRWLERGFSVEEICAGWPSLADGQDAQAWRSAWQGMALTSKEIAAWHAKFDHDEALKWLNVGVRDPAAANRLRARGFDPRHVSTVTSNRYNDVLDRVPVNRDDLLSAAGHLSHAGGSAEIRQRLQVAASAFASGESKEVSPDLIEDVLDELRRLDENGALGAPHAARALARRLERGLIVSALNSGRDEHPT